jgi:hypothetical protein
MTTFKLELLEDDNDSFALVALHTSLESYRIAYFLNKYLGFSLVRTPEDHHVAWLDHRTSLPVFKHFDEEYNVPVYLTKNKYTAQVTTPRSTGGLFSDTEPDLIKSTLIKEYPKVDYLLKIEQESEWIDVGMLVQQLLQVPEVISAYELDIYKIKQTDYLIFE